MAIGLAAALTKKSLTVATFKKGPDFIDPLWLSKASGSSCYNLDFNVQNHSELIELFSEKSVGADVALIEGNKGLYDGLSLDGSDANSAMAKLIKAPVVMVVDTLGVTRGIAPLLLGYRQFDPDVKFAGVILNKVGGERHLAKLRAAIETYTDFVILGHIPRTQSIEITERHLGLVPSNEEKTAQAKIDLLASTVNETVNLDLLLDQTVRDDGLSPITTHYAHRYTPDVKLSIGVAKDSAFGFYYADDLETMERLGVELKFFSPLSDQILPQVDGLLIGGGFPETHADALASNHSMLRQIKHFAESGGCVYAECGGLMYLARSITWRGQQHDMAGVIQADVTMMKHSQGRGYVQLQPTDQHPWKMDMKEKVLMAHEFHYSRLDNIDRKLLFAYKVMRGVGIDGVHDGIIYKNVLAGYAHLRNAEGSRWVDGFLNWVQGMREIASRRSASLNL